MLNIFISAVIVKGDGSSIWMDSSNVKATVTSFDVRFSDDPTIWDKEDFGKGYSLTAYGSDMPWETYTDRSIETQMLKIVRPYLKNHGYSIEWLTWSEQGMQKTDAWNFDVKIIPEKKVNNSKNLEILTQVTK
jgi:hypothetical protein